MNDEKAHKFVRLRRLFLVTMQYFRGQNTIDFACFAGNAVAKRKPPTAVGGRRLHFIPSGDAKNGGHGAGGTTARAVTPGG